VFGAAWTLTIALTLQVAGGELPTPPQAPVTPASDLRWTDDRPLTRLFPNLFRDLRSLPSVNSAIVLSAGGGGAMAINGKDIRFASWSSRSGHASYAKRGSTLGNGWVQSGGAIATYAVGKLAGSPQITHLGSDLIRAQALNGLLTTAVKVSVGRTRPTGGHYAFPSGHTSAAFASAATLHAHYGWKAGVPAYATAAFVAWARVREREHWLSDVAFGSAIGIVAGRTIASKHESRRVTVVPALTKGGGAVMFFVNRP
jgi:hypothetical protein